MELCNETYRCTGASASDGVDLVSDYDLEVEALSSDVWESPTLTAAIQGDQCDGLGFGPVKPTYINQRKCSQECPGRFQPRQTDKMAY